MSQRDHTNQIAKLELTASELPFDAGMATSYSAVGESSLEEMADIHIEMQNLGVYDDVMDAIEGIEAEDYGEGRIGHLTVFDDGTFALDLYEPGMSSMQKDIEDANEGDEIEVAYESTYSGTIVTKTGTVELTDGCMLSVDVGDGDTITVQDRSVVKYADDDASTWRAANPDSRRPLGTPESVTITEEANDDFQMPFAGDELEVVYEETDEPTSYTRDIVAVKLMAVHPDGYHSFDMLDADRNVVCSRHIAPRRVEANLTENDGAFSLLVPEGEPKLVTDGGEDVGPKVRFVSFYNDPSIEDHLVLTRYTANKPRQVITMYNFETEERRTCELIDYRSTGGWVTHEEAQGMVNEFGEDVFGEDEPEDEEPELVTDGGVDVERIVEHVPAIKEPSGEAKKRFVHRTSKGTWEIRATRNLDSDPNSYRAECTLCGETFSTFGRASEHIKTCEGR